MSKRAIIIGAAGQIGSALTNDLLSHGWSVRAIHRGSASLGQHVKSERLEEVIADRNDDQALLSVIGSGCDALIDCVAYEERHAKQLLDLKGHVGALAVISTVSVYCDDRGRPLEATETSDLPDFSGPVSESQQTVAPGADSYAARKVAVEQTLLDRCSGPVTILRPSAIHGLHSRHPREWWFVKRMLDHRHTIPLLHGESVFHTTATQNLAELCRLALEQPGRRILNSGDRDPLTVRGIGEAIAAAMSFRGQFVDVAENSTSVGETPWSLPLSFVLDLSSSESLGFAPKRYEAFLEGECRELLDRVGASPSWKTAFPTFDRYSTTPFNYEAEDELIAAKAA